METHSPRKQPYEDWGMMMCEHHKKLKDRVWELEMDIIDYCLSEAKRIEKNTNSWLRFNHAQEKL